MMEYKTTQQAASIDPEPPSGDDWVLVNSVSDSDNIGQIAVYMYWQRPAQHRAKECRKCNAVAFRDGRCIGCNTPLED